MIIDADVTILTGKYDAEDILRDMQISGVDRSLVGMRADMGLCDPAKQISDLNEISEKSSGRITGIAHVDPRLPQEAKLVEKCAELRGIGAVMIDSAQCHVRLDDLKTIEPVMNVVSQYGYTLFVRVSSGLFDLTHPMRLSRLLDAWPQIRVAAINMGGASRPDFCADVFETARKHDNLWLIGSANYWQRIPQAIRMLGADRVLFGSASPDHCFMPSAVAAYRVLLNDGSLSDAEKEMVFGGNAAKLLCRV